MKKLYLFITALMCAVGVTNVNAQETVSLKLGCAGAKMEHGTGFGNANNVLPTADAVKNRLADKTAGMYWGVSQNPSDPSLNTDFRSTDNTRFTFKGRQGYSGESVAQVYEIDGEVSSLTVSFTYTSTDTNSSFSIWKVSSGEAVCLASKASKASNERWVSGAEVSFSVNCTEEEGKAVNFGDRLVLLWNASSMAVDVTISEFTGSMNITVDYAAKLRALLTTAQDLHTAASAVIGTEVGEYSQTSVVALNAAISDAERALANEAVTEGDVTALQNAINVMKRNMPVAGKFYQLASWKTGNENKVAFAKTNNNIYWGLNETPAAVWVFEDAGDGEYYLKNLSTGCYMDNFAGVGAQAPLIEGNTQTVSVVPSNDGRKVGIKLGNNIYLDRDQRNEDANGCKPVCRWGDSAIPTGDNRKWLINEVDPSTIKHTITMGAAGWATVVLGFNATIPSNAEVYVVESTTSTEATLKPVTGVLGANTGVLVKAAGGTVVDFAYSAESATVTSSGMLGTLYDKNITPAGGKTCYVLAMPADATEAGFYKAELNQDTNTAFKNNANKAYLSIDTPVGGGAPMLSFDFGTETGISGISAARTSNAIYDLSGRRVKSALKGIYIMGGKKVIK